MKKPLCIELAERYCEKTHGFNNHEFDAFIAGYQAVLDIIQAELKLVQTHRANTPGLGALHEYALKSLLNKIDEV